MLSRQRSIRRRRFVLESLEDRCCPSLAILSTGVAPNFFPLTIKTGVPEQITFNIQALNSDGSSALTDQFIGSKVTFGDGSDPVPMVDSTGHLIQGKVTESNGDTVTGSAGNAPSVETFVFTHTYPADVAGTSPTLSMLLIDSTAGQQASFQGGQLINAGTPIITSANHITFTTGGPNTFTVTATGAAPIKLTESGALPNGVTFQDNGNGKATLSGTPTSTTGSPFTLLLGASNGISPQAAQQFTLTVNLGAQAPKFQHLTNIGVTNHAAQDLTITATANPTAAITEVGNLPPGMTFHDNGNNTATISGTPNVANLTVANSPAEFPIIPKTSVIYYPFFNAHRIV